MENVLKDLSSIGFSDYESQVYVGLLQCGPATAYEVANVAGLPRANAYTVVKILSEKYAVLPLTDKPVQYVAVDPKELFKGIANNTVELCDRVAQKGTFVEIVLFSSSPESFDLGKNCKIHPHEGNGKILRRSDDFLTITADSQRALIASMKGDINASYSEFHNS